jgi:hypothetical protein
MHKMQRKQRYRRTVLITTTLAVIISGLITLFIQSSSSQATPFKNNQESADTHPPDVSAPKTIGVKKHDTLTKIFKRHRLHLSDLNQLLKVNQAKHSLAQLKPRQTLYYKTNANGHLLLLEYPINKLKRLISVKQGRPYRSIVKQQPLTSKVLYASATIDHSLARAVKQAGLTRPTSAQLKSIYAGSLNLEKHAHRGDHFGLLYREYYLHGKRYKQGDIIASIYTHKDKNYSAVHYTYPKNHSGYYTPDDHGVELLFLKVPLHYRRISSIFTYAHINTTNTTALARDRELPQDQKSYTLGVVYYATGNFMVKGGASDIKPLDGTRGLFNTVTPANLKKNIYQYGASINAVF